MEQSKEDEKMEMELEETMNPNPFDHRPREYSPYVSDLNPYYTSAPIPSSHHHLSTSFQPRLSHSPHPNPQFTPLSSPSSNLNPCRMGWPNDGKTYHVIEQGEVQMNQYTDQHSFIKK